MAVSWMCTSNPARGQDWLTCTLPTLPQSQNLWVWALLTSFPVLRFHVPVRTGMCMCVCVCVFEVCACNLIKVS